MTESPTTRVYLDNAATSWPKPPAVAEAVRDYIEHNGAPAGRSVYRTAREAERIVAETRRLVAQFLGGLPSEGVVFTSNGTDSLNLAIHGWVREGDHVVTTMAEHNSVLRPLYFLQRHRGIELDVVPCDASGRVDLHAIEQAIRAGTRLVAVTAASNVTGAVSPVERIGPVARRAGARLLVDAAQILGHRPFDATSFDADFVAAPAHKGLLGILGLGILWVRPELGGDVVPLRQGGSGVDSESPDPPESLPERLEAGNLNVPAIAALKAGIEYLQERGVERVAEHESRLSSRLREGLARIGGVTLVPDVADEPSVGVVSFTLDAFDPQEVAMLLDLHFGVECRAGLHCAPRVHERLGTAERGGTIRMSVGPFTTDDQIGRAIEAVAALASG